jgi:hypothetical protein
MKKFLLLLVFLVSISGFSQSINDYQYVIVPAKFSLFKENDRYRLNSTTKMLLEKYGFKVFMSNENIPNEIGNCEALYADLVEDKSFLTIKVKVVLKDCKENIVYETEFGKSREKEFAIGYNQALRETAKSFDKLNYQYNGKNGTTTTTISSPATKAEEPNDISEILANKAAGSLGAVDATDKSFYFAQPTATGFQVVDNEPKVILRLFNTSQKNVFISEKGMLKGVVISKNGQWFFEYYEGGKLVSELLKLKF